MWSMIFVSYVPSLSSSSLFVTSILRTCRELLGNASSDKLQSLLQMTQTCAFHSGCSLEPKALQKPQGDGSVPHTTQRSNFTFQQHGKVFMKALSLVSGGWGGLGRRWLKLGCFSPTQGRIYHLYQGTLALLPRLLPLDMNAGRCYPAVWM